MTAIGDGFVGKHGVSFECENVQKIVELLMTGEKSK